ncbi:MAG TPA: AraC family transcriptional regulator [Pseudolabrys sp.]|nr:AraC family transcriptional regulator [Pseudolabrys sp.]
MDTAADSRILHFASGTLPARDGIALWREVYGRTILRLDIEPLPDTRFEADIRLRMLPGLRLLAGTICGVRDARTRALIADGNDDFGLALNWSGRSVVSQCGRQATLGDGDAVLLSCGHLGTVERPLPSRYIGIRIPRNVLTRLVPNADALLGQPLPRSSGILRMLHDYVGSMLDESTLAPAELQHLAVNHIYDLVAIALGGTRDATAVAEGRGLRAARLRAIKADIARNLRGRLALEALAARHQVTPRYVQRLFESEGTSFTSYVLGQRLNQAHRLLTDPRLADRAISVIAFEVGFGDLSYFNRAFRRQFGATPSEVRAQALRK